MVDDPAGHLAHAIQLEERDVTIARELETLRSQAGLVDALRAQVVETRARLEELPRELEQLSRRRAAADADVERARARRTEAASRLEGLERARRRKEEEIERARSEVATAQEELDDALAQIDRLVELDEQLDVERREREALVPTLAREARDVAAAIRALPRVADAAGRDPGATLDELQDWASHARAALFVARTTLEGERDKVVTEAVALGEAVLGEPLAGSPVALVRRRLEQRA